MIDIETLLARGAVYKKIAANEIIFSEGSKGNFYYQLISGSIRWTNITEQGRQFIQEMVAPGDSFGEFQLFDEVPYAASAIANTDSVIIRLSKRSFLKLLQDEPAIHFAFTRLFAERLRFKYLLLQESSFFGPEHRVEALMNYFKKTGKNICQICNQVTVTRQQIADMTGLRVETVIRSIRSLQRKGKLSISKGKVFY